MNWKTLKRDGVPKNKDGFKTPFVTCMVWVANPEFLHGGIPATCRWQEKENRWYPADLFLIDAINYENSKCIITHYIDNYEAPKS